VRFALSLTNRTFLILRRLRTEIKPSFVLTNQFSAVGGSVCGSKQHVSCDDVRIVAWNLNHRTGKKAIPSAVSQAILSLVPDVVVLTEYVEGPCHADFCDALKGGGLPSQFYTASGRHNQVLFAAREAASLGPLSAPRNLSHAAPNLLHVRLAEPALEIAAVRVPWYKVAKDRHAYWDWFETALPPLLLSSAVIIGDLNCDPQGSRGRGPKSLRRLAAQGWQLADPHGLGSYISHKGKTSRLDHALVSSAVNINAAAYIQSENGYIFMEPGLSPLSDHAPLVLDVALGAATKFGGYEE
jgi:endonuclease/exonuclease/phosphatase family metal-dependent hydrolase